MTSNQIVWIDSERCTECGVCIDTCPVGAVALSDGTARVDEERCTGCLACIEVCPQEAIQPLVKGELIQVEGELVRAETLRSVSPSPANQGARTLVEAAAPALAVAGAGLLAKATRALARAAGSWLTQGPERSGVANSEIPSGLDTGRANGRERRTRRRRRGR